GIAPAPPASCSIGHRQSRANCEHPRNSDLPPPLFQVLFQHPAGLRGRTDRSQRRIAAWPLHSANGGRVEKASPPPAPSMPRPEFRMHYPDPDQVSEPSRRLQSHPENHLSLSKSRRLRSPPVR